MYDKNVVHRDIKLDNLLVHQKENGEIVVKYGDFGFAHTAVCPPSGKLTDLEIKGECGTVFYNAPEVLLGKDYNYQVDIYSL